MRNILTIISLLLLALSSLGQIKISSTDVVKINEFRGHDTDSNLLIKSDAVNYGITNEVQVLSFSVENTSDSNISLFGYVDNPLLDNIGIIDSTRNKVILLNGESFPYHSRPLGLPAYAFPIQLAPRSSNSYYVALSSGEQIVVPVIVGNREVIISELHSREIFYAVYFGIILVMIIYNLFVYLSVKDKVYVYYVFYILTVGLTQLVISGYANKYFWASSPNYSVLASSLIPILSGMGTVVFARSFIRTKVYAPFIDKLLLFYFGAYCISILFAVFSHHVIAQYIINFNAASALILVIAAYKAISKGYRPAKFFLVAFSMFLIGVTLYALRNFGVLGYNLATTFALPVGSAIETILLSFALADRINQFKKEKEESQLQAITVMQENQRLVEEQNVKLEYMVHERTVDLERTNGELNNTLQDLRLTQKQLVESEKLASLGQMTAGIAHEINNPINFVQSNVQPLRRDIDDMLGLLDEFARLENDETITEKVTALHKRYAELDMPYLRQEVNQLLHGIEEGSRRTAEIVRGLRVFSRMDRDSVVSASINDCIQSTLIVMKNMTKGNVTLFKELKDDLPNLHCLPGKLNQVFMNILTNAVQATDVAGRTEKDRIVSIHSDGNDKEIRITITDNGSGISEEIRSKIFDPFFTTKQVGEGTGLGLSIALGIVKEHQGQIEVHSTQGKGTTVVVVLPRNAENA